MIVDLHTHSTASDGSDPPERLVELAARSGLGAIALTDHDTQEGVAAADATAADLGVELIPGVELSLAYETGGMHLVVLWLPPGSGPLQDRLAGLQSGRHLRNMQILTALAALGMAISEQEVRAEAGGGSVGRPHIAAVMMARGYVPDIRLTGTQIVIECDGWEFHGMTRAQFERDRERDQALTAAADHAAFGAHRGPTPRARRSLVAGRPAMSSRSRTASVPGRIATESGSGGGASSVEEGAGVVVGGVEGLDRELADRDVERRTERGDRGEQPQLADR